MSSLVLRRSAVVARRLASPSARRSLATTTHYKKVDRSTDERWAEADMERFADETDLLIVGGGPAGL